MRPISPALPRHPLLQRADLGSPDWWQAVQQTGTPLIQAMDEASDQVFFLWRDPQGGPQDSACQQVYIDVYSHTPHPLKQLSSLQRIGQSDVWCWQTVLPKDWCGSYFLLPAEQQHLPPSGATRAQMRQWWTELMAARAQSDSLNPLPTHSNGSGVSLSRLQLSQALQHAVWQQLEADFENDSRNSKALRGQLQTLRWNSSRLHTDRTVWLYRTQGKNADTVDSNLPLVLLLDGQYWAQHMPLFPALDELSARGDLPAALYLFIDAVNHTQRASDLPCNADFWLAVQQELLPQACALQAFSADPRRSLVAGQSYGGLAAMYAAWHWPQRFGLVLSQSGSFWWPDANETGDQGWLTRQVRSGSVTPGSLHVWMEVGCYETDMTGVNQAMCAALKSAGHPISYREFRGGHDWICWRNGLLSGLCDLLSAQA